MKEVWKAMKVAFVVCFCLLGYLLPATAQQSVVPMVMLLARPDEALVEYPEGVSTLGYLHFSSGDSPYLFLTRDHALALDVTSAIFLLDDTKGRLIDNMKCDNEYVRVVGSITADAGALSFNHIVSIRRTDATHGFCFVRGADQ